MAGGRRDVTGERGRGRLAPGGAGPGDTGLARVEHKGEAGGVVRPRVTDPAVPTRRLLLVGVGDREEAAAPAAGAGAALARRRGAPARWPPPGRGAGRGRHPGRGRGALLAAYRFRAEGRPRSEDRAHARCAARAAARRPGAHAARAVTGPGRRHRRRTGPATSPTPRRSSRTRRGWPARPCDLGRRRGSGDRAGRAEHSPAEGFGGVLAVGAGSARRPRLVEMAYRPAAAGGRPRRAGGQGHHLRLRRPLPQAARRRWSR